MPPARLFRFAAVSAALLAMLAFAGPARPATVTEATGGQALDVRLDLSFAPGAGSRTVVRGVVTLPPSQASRNRHGFYNLALAGEVLVGGRIYDRFGYRYDVPADGSSAASLTLMFERALRPGTFRLDLRVEDLQTGRVAQVAAPLEVPRLQAPSILVPANGETAGATEAPAPAQPVRLVPPPAVVVGKHRFEAIADDPAVATVAFLLDGKRVVSRGRPPFTVELDLGDQAALHRLRVEAYDAAGKAIGADEVELNSGEGRFAVRLVAPPATAQQSGHFVARVEVDTPADRAVDRVELFLDDRPLGELRRLPYVLPVKLGGPDPALLRAVAYLPDGTAAEGSLLLNAPHSDIVDVDLVELYTAVVDRRGRPVRGLAAGQFEVFEEGARQRLERFEEVDDLPLHVALLIDTSMSMTLRMPDVQAAAREFVEQMVTPRDRVTLITFDSAPRVRVDFTNDLAFLANGLEGLRAQGGTALYDSLVFALEQLHGIQGQRVVVLLSDGMDERSRATANEVLELARRSAVTLYTVGLDDRRSNVPALDRPLLQRLADESGGAAYFVDGERALRAAYAAIEHDVRSRYLLAYYSSHAGAIGSFRLVDVTVAQPTLAARTIRGYYP